MNWPLLTCYGKCRDGGKLIGDRSYVPTMPESGLKIKGFEYFEKSAWGPDNQKVLQWSNRAKSISIVQQDKRSSLAQASACLLQKKNSLNLSMTIDISRG